MLLNTSLNLSSFVSTGIRDKDSIFFVAYGMWLVSSLITASTLEPGFIPIRRIFTYGAMLLLIFYELKNGYWSYRELAALVVLVVFGISYINASTAAMTEWTSASLSPMPVVRGR